MTVLASELDVWQDEWVGAFRNRAARQRESLGNGCCRRKQWVTAPGTWHDVRVPRAQTLGNGVAGR